MYPGRMTRAYLPIGDLDIMVMAVQVPRHDGFVTFKFILLPGIQADSSSVSDASEEVRANGEL